MARARNGRLHATPDHRSDLKVPVVYFAALRSPGYTDGPQPRIKVGESGDCRKRMSQHRKGALGVSMDVEELCVVLGTRTEEQVILDYFKAHCVPGEREIFWPSDEVIGYIRWLRDQYYVWVPDCEQCPPLEEMEQRHGTDWLPKPERYKAPPSQKGLFNEFGELRLPSRVVTPDDFYTNPVIIEAARRAMGGIDLDPASHAFANMKVKATRFYTEADDGLLYDWAGRVWLNPPFGQWATWTDKLLSEWAKGGIESVCVLCATRTLTAQSFHPVHEHCTAMCILNGRIPFWGGKAKDGPTDGHAIFYFGSEPERFVAAFGEIGNLYRSIVQLEDNCDACRIPVAVP